MRGFRLPSIHHLHRLSLSRVLMVYFTGLSLLPLLTLGIISPLLYASSIDTEARDHTSRMISQVSRGVEYYVQEAEKFIDFMATREPVRALLDGENPSARLKEEILSLEQGIASSCPEFAGSLILTASDELLSAEYSRLARDPLVTENWYVRSSGHPGTLGIYPRPFGRNLKSRSSVGSEEVVSVAKALSGKDGKVALLILIDLRLSVVEDVFRDTAFGQSGFLFITDPQGEVVWAPRNRVIYRVPLSRFTDEQPVHIVREAGVDYQVISRRSAYTGWRTFGAFSLPESRRAATLIRLYTIAIGLLTLLAAVIASLFLTRAVARPILALEELMKKAEGGDFSVRFAEERADEIGQLGRGFNTMIATIHDLIDQVYREQRLKREAELRILQEQIKPHFLYNTLDTIQWMAQEKGADEIVCMVSALTDLFRIGLSKGKESISLSEEFKHIESYLCIQKARYEDKFDYRLEMDSSLSSCQVLRLILQPLVENALYHGIKERRGHGNLTVTAEIGENCLLMRVTDDGAGMTAETRDALNRALDSMSREGFKGYGVFNVNERIRLTYGRKFGLSFQERPGGGTIAQLLHPLIREEEN